MFFMFDHHCPISPLGCFPAVYHPALPSMRKLGAFQNYSLGPQYFPLGVLLAGLGLIGSIGLG
jgi:hypothetical protein